MGGKNGKLCRFNLLYFFSKVAFLQKEIFFSAHSVVLIGYNQTQNLIKVAQSCSWAEIVLRIFCVVSPVLAVFQKCWWFI